MLTSLMTRVFLLSIPYSSVRGRLQLPVGHAKHLDYPKYPSLLSLSAISSSSAADRVVGT
jgi:hypothetical protein